jgi:hypothetical protein
MKAYPSIEQFRNVIRAVRVHHDYQGKDEQEQPIYAHTSPYPKLIFTGTVKLHGTNASVVQYKDGHREFQSRERVLSLTQDNAQFMLKMMNKQLDFLFEGIEYEEYIAVYGEWCGGSIQKGVAINGLPLMFVIFGCKVDGQWIPYRDRCDNTQGIYNIHQFPTYEIEIDFEQPEFAQNKLVELTEEIERECPVGKYFGNSGIGEGLVWSCQTEHHHYQFKTKGEKHSVSKVTTIASVDTAMVASIQELVEKAVTENRLLQGIEKLKEMGKELDVKSTGDFLRWVVNDVIKEEQDTIIANEIDPKKLNPAVSNKARLWFINYINSNY